MLRDFLDRGELYKLAGRSSFRRGEEYFLDGHVISLREVDDALEAVVRGGEEYQVRIWVEADTLRHSCTCPVGREGEACKHVVAAALTWLEPESAGRPDDHPGYQEVQGKVADALRLFDRDGLIALILEHTLHDATLRNRILLRAAGADLKPFQEALRKAIVIRGSVDYRSARAYVDRVEAVVESIGELLGAGHAAAVVELVEHGVVLLARNLGSVDDSDGGLGGVVRRLQELHLEGCRRSRPDPVALAAKLFEWELGGALDGFSGVLGTYAELLGASGLAEYRRRLEIEWAKVHPRLPGEDRKYGDHDGYHVTWMMERLARHLKDVDLEIDVRSRDLSSALSFLRIAELCEQHGRAVEALDWAERGLRAFPEHPDTGLRDFVARAYQALGRRDEAMALMWADFADRPDLNRYKRLKRHADMAKVWPAWREKAIAEVRRRTPDASLLVEIFEEEGDVEQAWREAQAGGCEEPLWLGLAEARRETHPADVLPIYQRHLETVLGHKDYHRAVEVLKIIKDLLMRMNRPADFPAYLDSVLSSHKRKTTFAKLVAKSKDLGAGHP